MHNSRRDLMKCFAAVGGSALLLPTVLFADKNSKTTSSASISANIKAVRSAAIADIAKTLENEEFDVHALAEFLSVKSTIRVKNLDAETVHVRISKACGEGQDGYWECPQGHTEPWKRCVYHRVTIKASYDRETDFDSVDHTMMASTGCNYFEINGGRIVYAGQPDNCL